MKPFKTELMIDDTNFDVFLQLIGMTGQTPRAAKAAPAPTADATPGSTTAPVDAPEDSRDYTITELRAAATELARIGRQLQLQELLRKHGADRLSALPTDHYAAFMRDLEALNE